MIKDTSVVIIVRNGESHLQELLESVSTFSEVIIYDNGSTDRTQQIAALFPNVKWFSGEFMGFGPTKQHAVSLASNDWILSLDADEIVTKHLITSIEALQLTENQAGIILRENYFMGAAIHFSGWGNDKLIRFFNRKTAGFNQAQVHEQVIPQNACQTLSISGSIKHYAVDDLSQFLEKINRYSSIRADSGLKAKHPIIIVLKSLFAFFRSYILKAGILDGWRGLIISVSNANGVFWKYTKAYARDKEQKKPS